MKVKIADLKANLSHHLRKLRETGELIEVCLREEPVAYITSASHSSDAKSEAVDDITSNRLESAGLLLLSRGSKSSVLPSITSSVAGDGHTDISTMDLIRREKEW